MNCPQCHSHMHAYQTQSNEKSQVSFYRCTVCVAEHVSSSLITARQLGGLVPSTPDISANSSQNGLAGLV